MTPLDKLRRVEEEMLATLFTDEAFYCGPLPEDVNRWFGTVRAIREEMEKERAFLKAAYNFCRGEKRGEPETLREKRVAMLAAYRALEGT